MIKPDSVSELIKAIERIRVNPKLGEQLAKNAQKDSKQYSWEERAKRILEHALRE